MPTVFTSRLGNLADWFARLLSKRATGFEPATLSLGMFGRAR